LDGNFTSLDNQRESAEAFIRSQQHEGWLALSERYDDGGFSAATTNRPALQHLLKDVGEGKLDAIVVYKLDRLSRSLLDFLNINRQFEERGVTLISVTEPINTKTPMGRAFLSIMLSFAQAERETTAERTRDKVRAARRKGKFVGGGLILGYDRHPDGGRLVVNEPEAERVRHVFRLFLEAGSLVETVSELNRRGWTMKRWTTKEAREYGGKAFSVCNLRGLLQNPAYVAKVHFDGQVIPAEHEAIVDRATWDAVQAALDAGSGKPQRRSTKNPSLLAGILRCAPCDSAMTPTYSQARGRRYRYYLCLKAHRQGWASCPSKSVPALQVDQFVIDKVRAIGRDPELVAATVEASRQGLTARRRELETEVRRLQNELDEVHDEIRKGMVGLSRSHQSLSRPSTPDQRDEVQRLEDAMAAAHCELEALRGQRIDADDLRAALATFEPVWDHLTSHERARVVQLLIDRIDYDGGSGSLKITFAPAGVRTLAAEAGR
jgi:site-specific DNA recombinase